MDQKKLKIVYILHSLSIGGGLERIETEKCNALAATGSYEVTVVCACQKRREDNAFLLSDEVREVCLGEVFNPKHSFRSRPLSFIIGHCQWRRKATRKMLAVLDELQPDIIVTTLNYMPDGFRRLRAKTIIECHGNRQTAVSTRLYPWYSEWMTRRQERAASAVVTLTAEDAAQWKTARRVETIPNFVELQCCATPDYSSCRVVALGRLCDQKGFDKLIDAWLVVTQKHPDWHLDIYGEGELRNGLQQQIDCLGLSKNIALLPFTKDIVKAYTSAAFYVLSSNYEGFGMVLVEAMRCGLPCVAFDCPSGPREIISDGHDGILVSFRNLTREERVANLAAALCQMIESEANLPSIGEEARKKSMKYTATNILPMWEKLFRSI